ncbi:TerB family tellurite resistance protein [Aliiglaciecola litoralis]|uniref:Co-chaperone DjlA N-terminal domain-containing protein n=1 Tax=Aliiglaciecola litoralis TaxID=582857 RepID=A0ABN1LDC9_9ALTE
MFKSLSAWFQEQLQQSHQPTQTHTVELATAVLLYEVMRADHTVKQAEQDTFENIIETEFSLSEIEKDQLLSSSKKHADHAVDFHQFTSVINQHCNAEEKRAILESLWKIAFADEHIDVHETHLIRRISDLLHLPHSEFIQAKLKVTEAP